MGIVRVVRVTLTAAWLAGVAAGCGGGAAKKPPDPTYFRGTISGGSINEEVDFSPPDFWGSSGYINIGVEWTRNDPFLDIGLTLSGVTRGVDSPGARGWFVIQGVDAQNSAALDSWYDVEGDDCVVDIRFVPRGDDADFIEGTGACSASAANIFPPPDTVERLGQFTFGIHVQY